MGIHIGKNDQAGSLVTWLKRLGLYMAGYASACIEVKSFAFNAYVVSIKSQTSVYQIQGSAKDKQNAINVHPKIFNFLRKFSKSAKKIANASNDDVYLRISGHIFSEGRRQEKYLFSTYVIRVCGQKKS